MRTKTHKRDTALWLLVLAALFLWLADLSIDELAKSPSWHVKGIEVAP